MGQELHPGGGPAVIAHIAEAGGGGGRSDGDLHHALVGGAGGVSTHVGDHHCAAELGLGLEGHLVQGVDAAGGIVQIGVHGAPVPGGAGVVKVQPAAVEVGGGEADGAQGPAATGGAGGGKVAGAEIHSGAVGGVADRVGLPQGGVLNHQRAGEGLAAGVPAGEGDGHPVLRGGAGHKGQVRQAGGTTAIIFGGARSLFTGPVVQVVELAHPARAAPVKGEVVQPVAGLVPAEAVQFLGVQTHRLAGGALQSQAGGDAGANLEGQGAVELLASGVPSGEAQGDGAFIVLGGDEGQLVQIGCGGAVVFGVPGGLPLAGLVVLMVQGALGGGRQVVEADVVQGAARCVPAQVVEVPVVQRHGAVDRHLVGHVALAGGAHGELHRAGEGLAAGVPAGEGDGDRALEFPVGDKGDGVQVDLPAAGAVVAGVLVTQGRAIPGTAVEVAVQGALGGGGTAEGDEVQGAAHGIPAGGLEVVPVEQGGPTGGGGVFDDAASGRQGELDCAGVAVAVGIHGVVIHGDCTGAPRRDLDGDTVQLSGIKGTGGQGECLAVVKQLSAAHLPEGDGLQIIAVYSPAHALEVLLTKGLLAAGLGVFVSDVLDRAGIHRHLAGEAGALAAVAHVGGHRHHRGFAGQPAAGGGDGGSGGAGQAESGVSARPGHGSPGGQTADGQVDALAHPHGGGLGQGGDRGRGNGDGAGVPVIGSVVIEGGGDDGGALAGRGLGGHPAGGGIHLRHAGVTGAPGDLLALGHGDGGEGDGLPGGQGLALGGDGHAGLLGIPDSDLAAVGLAAVPGGDGDERDACFDGGDAAVPDLGHLFVVTAPDDGLVSGIPGLY